MSITVAINGEDVVVVDVFNRGPLPDDPVGTDDPDGPRRYVWRIYSDDDEIDEHALTGEVIHWRVDGAAALAGTVLRACSCAAGEPLRRGE